MKKRALSGKSGRQRRLLWDVPAVFMQRGVHPNNSYGIHLAKINAAFPAKLFVRVEKAAGHNAF